MASFWRRGTRFDPFAQQLDKCMPCDDLPPVIVFGDIRLCDSQPLGVHRTTKAAQPQTSDTHYTPITESK